MNALIRVTQEQREITLGKGLAIAISDLIVTREYAEIESNLQQTMGNPDIRSVLVVDLQGNVLGSTPIPSGQIYREQRGR